MMSLQQKSLIHAFAFMVFTLLFAVDAAAAAAAATVTCKGMVEESCKSADTCTWVNSYTTSTGKTVNGYCRTKSAKKSGKTSDKGSD